MIRCAIQAHAYSVTDVNGGEEGKISKGSNGGNGGKRCKGTEDKGGN
jgi:hypothetical protein